LVETKTPELLDWENKQRNREIEYVIMGFIGADGKFYAGQPKMANIVPQATSVWKQGDHDRQRADHKGDLVRPYLPSGEPNPEFISLYPEESSIHINLFQQMRK
jgi:hypothetical protein